VEKKKMNFSIITIYILKTKIVVTVGAAKMLASVYYVIITQYYRYRKYVEKTFFNYGKCLKESDPLFSTFYTYTIRGFSKNLLTIVEKMLKNYGFRTDLERLS
jgi:hypothetical protein